MFGSFGNQSAYLNAMRTAARSTTGPGRFTSNCKAMASSGWICSSSQFGGNAATSVSSNGADGAGLKRIAISVTRRVMCLPVRR
ncbi:hypothetical protein GALL_502610 [mine drainage metagenome]|uniref:Uncharacterized protein n=1 Tax=mine drainage metagenome TaxID=410659 RepID=A0A1J5PBP6_9ZZZZ